LKVEEVKDEYQGSCSFKSDQQEVRQPITQRTIETIKQKEPGIITTDKSYNIIKTFGFNSTKCMIRSQLCFSAINYLSDQNISVFALQNFI